MSTINYSDKIPNNVNLSEDRTLQRAGPVRPCEDARLPLGHLFEPG
ncbi:MAG: hypothetical protein RL081_1994 [Pseudomonadota bacterium]